MVTAAAQSDLLAVCARVALMLILMLAPIYCHETCLFCYSLVHASGTLVENAHTMQQTSSSYLCTLQSLLRCMLVFLSSCNHCLASSLLTACAPRSTPFVYIVLYLPSNSPAISAHSACPLCAVSISCLPYGASLIKVPARPAALLFRMDSRPACLF